MAADGWKPIHSARAERRSMNQALYEMDSDSRAIVLRTLAGVCSHRDWNLLAAPVRTSITGRSLKRSSALRGGEAALVARTVWMQESYALAKLG